jgi:2',3'-cyclic-nucleotide 2'-phosphodiesterase (5'-nucleotidase family)
VEEESVPLSVTPRTSRRGSLAVALFALFAIVIPAGVFAAKPPPPPPVDIQILNTSDWHGQIDPLPPGGAWSISARWAEERLVAPTLTVAAGDDFGATPPLSSFFGEVPAVLAQRLMGVQIGTFGNHNFDRGIAHLQEMIDLAAAPTDADHPGTPYRYVSANLANLDANLTGVEPFALVKVGGAKVAVIGITNEEAPGLVIPGAFGTIMVTDGVAAAEKYARIARKAGANAVVVITHKGVRGTDLDGNIFGELIDFAEALEPGLVDVVIGDHTDIQFSGTVNGILVHENRSKGFTYSRTTLEVQPGKGGGVLDKSMAFVSPVAPARTSAQLIAAECPAGTGVPDRYCDPAILEMLIPFRQELAVLLDPKIATVTAQFIRGGNVERGTEVAVGNLVAEGMLWFQGTDFAFVNSGGVRSPLPSSYTPLDASLDRSLVDGDPADLVLGDVYSVLPFTNTVLRRTVTGAQLWEAMENGVSQINSTTGLGADGRFPQIAGFKFAFDYSLATGCTGTTGTANWDCDNPGRVTGMWESNGTPIPRDGTVYTLAIPSFTNQGGDSYRVFLNNLQAGENEALDAFVMAEYIEFLGGGGFPELDPADWVDGRILKCGPAHPCL